jgi:Cu/Ag efflux pump CusA
MFVPLFARCPARPPFWRRYLRRSWHRCLHVTVARPCVLPAAAVEAPASWRQLIVRRMSSGIYSMRWSLPHPHACCRARHAVLAAAASVPVFPRAFLPAFNEGSLVMGMTFTPGTSLAEASRMNARRNPDRPGADSQVGHRTGRAELDEHAEGVHSSEIDVDHKPSQPPSEEIMWRACCSSP